MSTSRATWLTLIAALLAMGSGLAFVGRHLAAPWDGARLEPGATALTPAGIFLTPVLPSSSLQAGDLLLAVEGRSLASWAETLRHPFSPPPPWQPGDQISYTVLRQGERLQIPVTLGPYRPIPVMLKNWGTIIFALVFQVVATFVFIRRPGHAGGRVLFLAASALTGSTAWSFGLQVNDFLDGTGLWLFKIATVLVYNLYWTAALHFALVFPRPLPLAQRRPWLLPALYALPYLLLGLFAAIQWAAAAGMLDWFARLTNVEGVHAALFLALTLPAIVWQYRRSDQGITRQQMRWLALAAIVSGGGGLLFYILPGVLGLGAVGPNVVGLIVLPFPLAIAIAILRYNLFDIDTLLNRALVYGALSASTVGLYVFAVGFLGNLVQSRQRSLIAFATTGLVAVIFQPLRLRLQRWVNRMMYGERDDPYAVLARLGRRLEAVVTAEAALPAIAETVAQALKLPYVAIALRQGGHFEIAASFGLPASNLLVLPLTYQTETVGQLLCAPRGPEEHFTPAEQRLLRNIARQAGAAAHAVRLTADLRRSRQRLVTAREEERRRLRRDLHDGLGSTLAALHVQAGALRQLMGSDQEAAESLLQELRAEMRAALAEVRRLINDLRPKALDELGLVGAIRARAAQIGGLNGAPAAGAGSPPLQITVEAPEPLPPLPAAVEVAVYRIALEALANVVKHAAAGHCQVRLHLSERLTLEVEDDGQGMPASPGEGVGLRSMRERAAELGGQVEIASRPAAGTRIRVSLPLQS